MRVCFTDRFLARRALDNVRRNADAQRRAERDRWSGSLEDDEFRCRLEALYFTSRSHLGAVNVKIPGLPVPAQKR